MVAVETPGHSDGRKSHRGRLTERGRLRAEAMRHGRAGVKYSNKYMADVGRHLQLRQLGGHYTMPHGPLNHSSAGSALRRQTRADYGDVC